MPYQKAGQKMQHLRPLGRDPGGYSSISAASPKREELPIRGGPQKQYLDRAIGDRAYHLNKYTLHSGRDAEGRREKNWKGHRKG